MPAVTPARYYVSTTFRPTVVPADQALARELIVTQIESLGGVLAPEVESVEEGEARVMARGAAGYRLVVDVTFDASGCDVSVILHRYPHDTGVLALISGHANQRDPRETLLRAALESALSSLADYLERVSAP